MPDTGFVIVGLSLDGEWARVSYSEFPSPTEARRWLQEQLTEGELSEMDTDYFIARKLDLEEFKDKYHAPDQG